MEAAAFVVDGARGGEIFIGKEMTLEPEGVPSWSCGGQDGKQSAGIVLLELTLRWRRREKWCRVESGHSESLRLLAASREMLTDAWRLTRTGSEKGFCRGEVIIGTSACLCSGLLTRSVLRDIPRQTT